MKKRQQTTATTGKSRLMSIRFKHDLVNQVDSVTDNFSAFVAQATMEKLERMGTDKRDQMEIDA